MKIVHPAVLLPPNMPSESYFDCRFAVLRAPLGFERGAERLADDGQAIHAWVPDGEHIIAVGRAHLIAKDSDGSAPDHAGPNASTCPPFGPLSDPENRPAIQIRQMGTREEAQRRGYASEVLSMLENAAVTHFEAKVALLQAREKAIPFYLSQGWQLIDEPYEIPNIGSHRSMMKRL